MKTLRLTFAAVVTVVLLAPLPSRAGVHIGFRVASPLCYTPPLYIGPTLFFGPGATSFYRAATYYSPAGWVTARPYWHDQRYGYFDWSHRWHSV